MADQKLENNKKIIAWFTRKERKQKTLTLGKFITPLVNKAFIKMIRNDSFLPTHPEEDGEGEE